MCRETHNIDNETTKRVDGGFTLVETVVAVLILMVALVGPIGLAQRSLQSAFQAGDKIIAAYLAQDAIEFVKNVRDTNVIDESREWLDGLDDCLLDDCRVDTTSVPITAPEGAICSVAVIPCDNTTITYNQTTGQYGHQVGAEWQSTKFSRVVRLIYVGPSEVRAEATVSWPTPFGTESISVNQNIFNPGGSAFVDLTLGLEVHYTFEEISGGVILPPIDHSGNGNDGVIPNNSPPWTSASAEGTYAADFNDTALGGTRYRVQVTGDPNAFNPSQTMTIAFYVRGSGQIAGSFNPLLVDKWGSGIGWFVQYRRSDSQLEMRIETDVDDKNRLGVIDGALALDDEWHHVVWVVDNGTVQAYLDGNSVGSSDTFTPGTGFASSEILCIADNCTATEQPFVGKIDDFRLYSRALSSLEVDALVKQSAPASNLVGYWNFDEKAPGCTGSGGTTPDLSGNGNDGIVNGAEWVVTGSECAMEFNHSEGDHISLGNPASLNFDGEITMMAWVKSIDAGINTTRIVLHHGYDASGDNPRVFLQVDYNDSEYHTGSEDDNGERHFSLYDFTAGEDFDHWIHVAGVYNSTLGTWEIYRNGVIVDSETAPFGPVIILDKNWSIGSLGPGTTRYFNGMIDNARIYNRALSETEISSIRELEKANHPY
jgi:type II secretory pathway pseudopilin PulG